MAKPFIIKLFMPSGNASELKLIEKMNWTGLGMEISRTAWPTPIIYEPKYKKNETAL